MRFCKNCTIISGEANLTTNMLAVWVNETLELTGPDQYTAGKSFFQNNTDIIKLALIVQILFDFNINMFFFF